MTDLLRGGIVGGGSGAFIGAVHRMAAELDHESRIVAGALSSDPARARASAAEWGLDRSYDSYVEMAAAEAGRDDGVAFVIVATPNHLHCDVARCFLEAGVPVICDKPLAHSTAAALELAESVRTSGLPFALTHNYSGYPAVQEMRARILDGQLGEIRRVNVEYHQDWLMTGLESEDNKQAGWRTDPARAGASCCVGDIGSHAEHLARYTTGLAIESIAADLTTFVEGRRLDDDASILLRFVGGARGVLTCSQVACGEENALAIRIYGTRAALEWRQQEPNTLILKEAGRPWQQLRAAQDYLQGDAGLSRLPPGHPSGYLEGFANVYRAFFADVRRHREGTPLVGGYPGIDDGVTGMRFIEAAVESSARNAAWVNPGG